LDRSMLYFGGIMLGVFALVSLLNQIIPAPLNQQIGGLVFLFGSIGGLVGLEASYILRTSQYPHLLMVIRPENEKVELFVDVPQSRKQRRGENLWSTTLVLKFPRTIKAYGDAKIKQLRLIHEYEYEQRVQFRPGSASLDDYDFNHPQTEYIEVVQLPGKQTSIDRAEVIPEFKLLTARNDYRLHLNSTISPPGKTVTGTTVEQKDLAVKVNELEMNLAQSRNDANYWHQQAISTEQLVELKSVETSGLLDQKGGIKEYAIEYVLTLLTAMGKIDKVADYLRGSSWQRWGKEVFAAIVLVFFIFVVWQNPQWLNGVYLWANNPQNQITIALIVVVTAILGIYVVTRRRN
jgi:hypothetical protein